MSAPGISDLAEIAIAAGALILEVYANHDARATAKADGSPVTEADGLAEALILARLAKLAPGVPVVSEEAAARGSTPETGERFYLVDPLDGTKEFLSRNGEFTVNIALVESGFPRIGVVLVPARGLLYAGSARGAFCARIVDGQMREPRSIHVREPGTGGLDVVASRSHMTHETEAFLRRVKVRNLVQAGSSMKFCQIAEGAADLYPRFGRTMEWDTAAGDAVLRAAGGRVLTLDGAPLAYGKRERGADDFANPDFIACGAFDPIALAAAGSGASC
jgi:3'(2'),5'-bisphosphate nucleotidase